MSIENNNIQNLTTTTFSTVRASFAGIGIYSGIQSLNADTYKKKLTNGIASLILIIAFFHYDKMNKLYEDHNDEHINALNEIELLRAQIIELEAEIATLNARLRDR